MSSHNHVVILGGGITGLSAAFHLARKHPTVQITLVEKSSRFGGWVRSERIKVHDSDGNRGSVLLEAGPRTIRPNAKSVLELVRPPPRPRRPKDARCIYIYVEIVVDTPLGSARGGHLYAALVARRTQ
jgi:glycine/D-amino acid oxidase-like deaminating enzyme